MRECVCVRVLKGACRHAVATATAQPADGDAVHDGYEQDRGKKVPGPERGSGGGARSGRAVTHRHTTGAGGAWGRPGGTGPTPRLPAAKKDIASKRC